MEPVRDGRDHQQHDEEEADREDPALHVQEHVHIDVLVCLGRGSVAFAPIRELNGNLKHGIAEPLAGSGDEIACHVEEALVTRSVNQPEQGADERQKQDKRHPNHVDAFLASEKGLQGEYNATLGPALHRGQVVHRVFGHAVGEAPVDVLRVLTLDNTVQTGRRVLNFATLVEEAVLEDLMKALAAPLDGVHLPNTVCTLDTCTPVTDEPRSASTTGRHAAAAITQHAVHAEEV
mmetsp:Transcript_82116/g.220716  ORF Transcript_82116/g.220716 Transcript_82116/m.220716 type:complete len:234 (-) Transcript_82116:748-1449(-)